MTTRYRIYRDDHKSHGGSKAVNDEVARLCAEAGIVVPWLDQVTPNHVRAPEYDCLVVNGEGNTHRGRKAGMRKLGIAYEALKSGKDVALLNCVWQEMPQEAVEVAQRCKVFTVRGHWSMAEARRQGLWNVRLHPDLAYQAPLTDEPAATNYGGDVVFTDHMLSGRWAPFGGSYPKGMPHHDLYAHSWTATVRAVETASLVVTGRHHMVVACLRARTPFVCVKGNTWKMEDLLSFGPFSLPVYSTEAEALAVAKRGTTQADWAEFFEFYAAAVPAWGLR